jgi:hypothetical protein
MFICKVSRKIYIFFVFRRKKNKCLIKRFYFGTKFCLVYIGHNMSRFFDKWLSTHVACEEVHAKLLFDFFDIFEMRQSCISNKGSICTHEPKHHSRLLLSLVFFLTFFPLLSLPLFWYWSIYTVCFLVYCACELVKGLVTIYYISVRPDYDLVDNVSNLHKLIRRDNTHNSNCGKTSKYRSVDCMWLGLVLWHLSNVFFLWYPILFPLIRISNAWSMEHDPMSGMTQIDQCWTMTVLVV